MGKDSGVEGGSWIVGRQIIITSRKSASAGSGWSGGGSGHYVVLLLG